jgi:dolichol-phosphate mannosyltransferase
MPAKRKSRKISFVLPVYNDEVAVKAFYDTLSSTVEQRPDFEYEFLFVNDGSRDRSWETLVDIAEGDERVIAMDLSRNFGHQLAVTAGLDRADGNAVVVMDTDLQDPPKVALELIKKWEEGFDVVYAKRRTRKDPWFKRMMSSLFYKVLRRLSDIEIPENTGDFRLLDRRVADQLRLMRENSRFLRGMVSYLGFRQVAVEFDRDARHSGESGYTFRKLIRFSLDGIMGFSTAPLRFMAHLGFFFSGIAFIGIVYAFVMKFARPDLDVPGWTLMIISVLLMGGIQLISLGIIGQYVGRNFIESKNRPLYAVREELGGKRA